MALREARAFIAFMRFLLSEVIQGTRPATQTWVRTYRLSHKLLSAIHRLR